MSDARKALRRVFGALFLLGVLAGIVFGSTLAAYDLWGGVPRSIWPLAKLLARGGIALLLIGGVGWVLSWPRGRRLRASLWAAAGLALTAALAGGGLWTHYAIRWESSRRICAPALIAPTRAEREHALAEGLGPLFPVIDPHSSCLQLLREKQELEQTSHCPGFVMNDVGCRCGSAHWQPGSVPACPTGPTACQYRSEIEAETLGCAAHGTSYTLESAEEALRERK